MQYQAKDTLLGVEVLNVLQPKGRHILTALRY